MYKTILTGFFFMFSSVLMAQSIAMLEVVVPYEMHNLGIPVATELDNITDLDAGALSLFEVKSGKREPIPFQISKTKEGRLIHWILDPSYAAGERIVFELSRQKAVHDVAPIQVVRENGSATLRTKDRNFLRYHYEMVRPPQGVDASYGRSGFIHPLWSPKGHELTRIQPPDHYHHYGIWNPWTHVLYEGDTIDFWNLDKKEGTVRFAKFIEINEGPVFGEYAVLHEHVVLKNSREEVALLEKQSVRVYRPSGQEYYIADISIEMSCAGDSPFLILEYRYAGLGWRTTAEWNNKNSEVLTSEGRTKKDADGSTARWCLVQGAIGNAHAGALMMSSPANYNHPEPLRIWPENQYDRGDMFANFSPTKNKDWHLMPGKTYSLNYRFIVFDGKFDQKRSEAAWQHLANPPKIKVKKP